MRIAIRLVPALCAVLGCGTENPAPGPQLPADVARVFQTQCASCHSTPPRFGAPMPLTSYADTQRNAPSDASRRVWQLVGQRVNDPTSPMPPTRLNATDLAVIDRWVAAGGPSCTGADCGSVNAAPPSNSPTLACEETHRFVAHAPGGTGAYRVPGSAGNLNKCFAFRSPFNGTTQATGFAAHIDSSRVLHHLILFATDRPQQEGAVFDCDGNMPQDARFLSGWAPGNQGTFLPSDVGMELPGPSGWFILQVHYWSTTPEAADDASGIRLCTTATPRRNVAAVHTLGSLDIAIPPRSTSTEVRGECVPRSTEPVHIINVTPHMHRRGLGQRTEILRGGDVARTEMMLDVQNYSFDSQVSTPLDMVVMPGDRIRTTCRFQNPGSTTSYFGERTEDEMCFAFVLAWPAGGLADDFGLAGRRCIRAVR